MIAGPPSPATRIHHPRVTILEGAVVTITTPGIARVELYADTTPGQLTAALALLPRMAELVDQEYDEQEVWTFEW